MIHTVPTSIDPKRVLVVDDSSSVRILVTRVLEEAGYEVWTVGDGSQACRLLEVEHFDAVVSDGQMPVMSGLELAQYVRARPMLAELPMILLTSMSAESDRRAGMAAGADEFICKNDASAMGRLRESIARLTSRQG